jgi:2Fe-2S ferredoxin
VVQGENDLPEISDKEEDFIDRAVNPRLSSRLACQCVVQAASENLVIEIPPQDFLGH